jgi:excisionase family DNA binding protein
MNEQFLSCREAGDILRISESTVKRLANRGQLKSYRTPGGHRRILRQSVTDWLIKQQVPAPSSTVETKNEPQPIAPGHVLEQLLKDDYWQGFQLIDAFHNGRDVATVLDELICPMLVEVGRRWRDGYLSVAQEHWISDRVREYLLQLGSAIPRNDSGQRRAIGSSPQYDLSDIASKCVELCFRDAGWNARSLGANLPASDLAEAAIEFEAQIVWVSYTHTQDQQRLVDENRTLRSLLPSDVRLVIGGRAMSSEVRRFMDFDFAGDTMSHLRRFALRS